MKFQGRSLTVKLDATASVADLKRELEAETRVQARRKAQRAAATRLRRLARAVRHCAARTRGWKRASRLLQAARTRAGGTTCRQRATRHALASSPRAHAAPRGAAAAARASSAGSLA